MAREVARGDAHSFFTKADEFLDAARQELVQQRFNAAGFCAVQAMINANDALTVRMLGKRATRNHREALKLYKEAVHVIDDHPRKRVFQEALEVRNVVGYMATSISKRRAKSLVLNATAFVSWVAEQLAR